MKTKRSIDPRYYGVSGYGNVPAYNIPYRATGHLMEHPARDLHKTLCGESGCNLYERTKDGNGPLRKDAWANLCKRCQKVAADEGLTEWVLKLRKGDCPDRSERSGKSQPHNWISYHGRCKDCEPVEKYRATRTCPGHHENYGQCNFCWVKDPERHFCDYWVARAGGYEFGPCDRPAKVEQQYTDFYQRTAWGWLCTIHTDEYRQAKAAAWQAKFDAEQAASDARAKAREDKQDAFDIAVEMARWIATNHDLAEEDEWLGQIAERMAGNDAIQSALEQE